MSKRVTLEARPERRAMLETKMRYAVMLDGVEFSDLYFNTRGYVGYLPCPRDDGSIGKLDIGECALATFRKEIANINRELAA